MFGSKGTGIGDDPTAPIALPDDDAPKKKSGIDWSRLKFWDRSRSDDELTNTDGIRGPLERILGDKARRKDSLAPLGGRSRI